MIVENLRQLGLNEKEIRIYLSLIAAGPSPVRVISEKAQVNRGTTYDILKQLTELGLVTSYDHYQEDDKRQYFVAEHPKKLLDAVEGKKKNLDLLHSNIKKVLPELEHMHEQSGSRPVVKYYEGNLGVKAILIDVIFSFQKAHDNEKEYYVYSSSDIREHLYKAHPNYNGERIEKGIRVKAIAIGKGGELAGLDERKWLSEQNSSPTYVLIYSGRVAMVSVDVAGIPVGVIIEDQGLYQTQTMIFKKLWDTL